MFLLFILSHLSSAWMRMSHIVSSEDRYSVKAQRAACLTGMWPFCCHLSDKKVLVPRLTWFYFLSPNGSENQVICQTTSVSCFGCLCSFCPASSWLVWSGLISDGAGVVEVCSVFASCVVTGFDGLICASCSGVMFLASSSCSGVILAPLSLASNRLASNRLA